MEEQLQQFALSQTLGFFAPDDPERYRGSTHFFVIDAAAIVLHFDENVIATMVSAHGHTAGIVFADVVAFFPAVFDAVGDGIPHQVNERIGDLLNNIVVEFGFSASQRQ